MKFTVETSAGGIVYQKTEGIIRWLIIQHAGKGHWGFPKGHVADKIENEQMEAAALREVEEEGGIRAKIVNDMPVRNEYFYKIGGKLRKKHVYYYLMEYISGDIANHDHEVSDIKWATEEELLQTITYQTEKDIFCKISKIYDEITS